MEHRSAQPPKGPTGPPPSWRPPPPPARPPVPQPAPQSASQPVPRIAAEPPRVPARAPRPGARRADPKPSAARDLLAKAEPAKAWAAERWASLRSSGSGRTGSDGTGSGGPGPRTSGGWRHWGKITAKAALVGFLALALIGSVTAIIAYNRISVPDPNAAFEVETSFVYYGNGKSELGRYQEGDQNRIKLEPDEIPDMVKHAVVAAEDRTFYENSGVDLKGIVRAAFSNTTEGTAGGASTITQQYVKNYYLSSERSYSRKLKEAVIALKLTRQKSKDRILTDYLNTIYFNRGAYGIEAAAKAYFAKPTKELSLREAVALAAILNNPAGFDPASSSFRGEEKLLGRYQYVLSGMVRLGYLKQAEADEIKDSLPRFPAKTVPSRLGGQRGHALTLIKNELLALKDSQGKQLFSEEKIDSGGLRITSTLSKKVMNASASAAKKVKPKNRKAYVKNDPDQKNALHVATASVDVDSGALLGFYGGQNYLDSQRNWAATGGHAGSTMKVFATAAAISKGYSLKSTWAGDSPFTTYAGSEVVNEGEQAGIADGMDYGQHITMLKALEQSVNTAYIDMTESMGGPEAGRKAIYDTAVAAGVAPAEADPKFPGIPGATTDFDHKTDDRIALGRANVSPINMANAYATIANGGYRHNVHVVKKVRDRSGNVLYSWNARKNARHAISEDVAADVTYAMQGVVQNGSGKKAQNIGRPVAGKTGTGTCTSAQYVCSSWFVGFTPQVATAVRYSRGSGEGKLDGGWMPSYFGADYPTETWAAIMAEVLDGKEVESFPEPVYVDGQDPETGHEEQLIAPPAPPAPPEGDGEHCDPVSEFFGTCDGDDGDDGGGPGEPGGPGPGDDWGGGNPWEGRP
ncbi:membrane peptidoglycan carboxypeptidase [Nocardioides luteus]|uniref:Carboxypeptidase n=1 Tax=Nocardioides luteus TaxID=1844 RepID=A0ABQ5T514_9ACTN|nr:transglycosylase domain-containing protein [Nocardioides luteus]MDR7311582.1 membrane peptidoglycan carboxypeptidase [Nocardioides luteus]GGR54618.1 carboxypeptidase [Nocardioides luteus]GLJ70231.1 carboxypeptidase [Nocardioides luteus]